MMQWLAASNSADEEETNLRRNSTSRHCWTRSQGGSPSSFTEEAFLPPHIRRKEIPLNSVPQSYIPIDGLSSQSLFRSYSDV